MIARDSIGYSSSAQKKRKIFIETPFALMASRATIHHNMLAAVYILLLAISADVL